MKTRNTLILALALLAILNILVWRTIILAKSSDILEIYFFDVGQGDSELIVLPGGVKILIDGGPNKKVLDDLAKILRPTDRYIDLVINSHPHPDHFIGLIDVLKDYEVGAFIYNGRDGGIPAWEELLKTADKNKAPGLVLAAQDKIHYQDNEFDILSPDKNFFNKDDLNETSLVALLKSQNFKALFAGDIGAGPEKYLAAKFDIDADVLKIGHHGSRFSSIEEFLKNISPKISVIEVGKNSYGHPTPEILARLASVGAQIYRTDNNGTVKITVAKGSSEVQIFKEK